MVVMPENECAEVFNRHEKAEITLMNVKNEKITMFYSYVLKIICNFAVSFSWY